MATAEYAVTTRPIASIRPYDRNPRVIPPEAIDAVARSIAEFGFRQPIVVDKEGVIIVGHTRYRAALKLGMKAVPVHVADRLTPEQVQAYRIADNSTNTLSSWDLEMLSLELGELPNFDLSDYGLDLEAVEPPTLATEDEFDVDAAVARVKVPRSQRGDVWLCGRHRVMCGDSTSPEDMASLMGDGLADCVWTDPPYNVAYVGRTREKLTIENDAMSEADFAALLQNTLSLSLSLSVAGASIYLAAPAGPLNRLFVEVFCATGWELKQHLVWMKHIFVLGHSDYHYQHEPLLYGWKPGARHRWYGGRSQSSVLQFDRPTISKAHPTMKPVALVGYCIANSTRRGHAVLDPFGGSGTTLVASEQLSREARLMELDPIYCDVIVGRWEQLTGQTATR